jgi:hypothetical protein
MREKIKEEKEKVKKEGAEEEEEEKTMKPEGGDLPPSAAFSQSPISSVVVNTSSVSVFFLFRFPPIHFGNSRVVLLIL